MELKISIPDFLSIKNYKQISSMEHLSSIEKMIQTIVILSDLPEETVREMQIEDISAVFSKVSESVIDIRNEFYPIIEIEGQLYGYNPISKFTLGEYVDLENLNKNALQNLEEIMALLYRPIVKHKFNGIKWAFKNRFKIGLGKAEHLFSYYTIEKYSSETRVERAEIMKDIPASFALGALTFFLHNANLYLLGSQISSDSKKETKKQIETIAKKMTSDNIGGGLQQFITSRKVPSLVSQEIRLLQI
jgi:hypothetical protein